MKMWEIVAYSKSYVMNSHINCQLPIICPFCRIKGFIMKGFSLAAILVVILAVLISIISVDSGLIPTPVDVAKGAVEEKVTAIISEEIVAINDDPATVPSVGIDEEHPLPSNEPGNEDVRVYSIGTLPGGLEVPTNPQPETLTNDRIGTNRRE